MNMLAVARALVGAAALGAFGVALPARAEGPLVAAAANLKFVLEEIAKGYATDGRAPPRLVFGATGNLVRQIRQGAPFEMLLAADEASVQQLAKDGLSQGEGRVYAHGRLVLFALADSPLIPDIELAGLRQLAASGTLRRLSIANPEHAPYGRAAREVLEKAGLWQAVVPRLVLGESVAQAMQFALIGDIDGGLVPYSLVLAPEIAGKGRYVLLPESGHQPIRQRMVLLRQAGEQGRRFYAYMQSTDARRLLARYGYSDPPPE